MKGSSGLILIGCCLQTLLLLGTSGAAGTTTADSDAAPVATPDAGAEQPVPEPAVAAMVARLTQESKAKLDRDAEERDAFRRFMATVRARGMKALAYERIRTTSQFPSLQTPPHWNFITTNCAAVEHEVTEARVREMRQGLKRAYADWLDVRRKCCGASCPYKFPQNSPHEGGAVAPEPGVHQPAMPTIGRPSHELTRLSVNGDRVVVFAYSEEGRAMRCRRGEGCDTFGDSTVLSVFDLVERGPPKLLRTLELSGSLIATNSIGSTVHVVLSFWGLYEVPLYGGRSKEDRCGPESRAWARFKQLEHLNEAWIRSQDFSEFWPSMTEGDTRHVLRGPVIWRGGEASNRFTAVVSLDISSGETIPFSISIQTRTSAVYAPSNGELYLSSAKAAEAPASGHPLLPARDETVDVHRVKIGDQPRLTRYLGSGAVPERALAQLQRWTPVLGPYSATR